MQKVIIIGSGFSGLSCAAILANAGLDVMIIEKNKQLGGRARVLKDKGYKFDMGPSWYWMPDIFEAFFNEFNLKASDFYKLKKLNPGFRMIFQEDEIDINSNFNEVCNLFEKYEKNGAKKLRAFIIDAQEKYNIGLDFLYKSPGLSIKELFQKNIIKNLNKFDLFKSYRNHVRKNFKHPYLVNLLEFPVIFLGSSAKNMPALYSLMSYSAIKQGTFYPEGGMNKIIVSLVKICKKLGVVFIKNEAVKKINIKNKQAISVYTESKKIYNSDFIVGAADYAHIEKEMLEQKYRNYNTKYWQKKTFSPSALIFYLGISKKIKKLTHHNLFFNANNEEYIKEIFEKKKWPNDPLFYVCCPSKTDNTVAPNGKENIFILMPIASGIEDSDKTREKFFKIIIKKLEKYCDEKISSHIEYKKSYCIKDFKQDYNSYKGNAYGLANTLLQTANFKPKIRNKKINNLFYTGQLTVPGPGVPPAFISAKLVSEQILKQII
tara:strand:- start:281 stop:1750 length:1470 start_codon:yes stop_codon:yes gene_type:complete